MVRRVRRRSVVEPRATMVSGEGRLRKYMPVKAPRRVWVAWFVVVNSPRFAPKMWEGAIWVWKRGPCALARASEGWFFLCVKWLLR